MTCCSTGHFYCPDGSRIPLDLMGHPSTLAELKTRVVQTRVIETLYTRLYSAPVDQTISNGPNPNRQATAGMPLWATAPPKLLQLFLARWQSYTPESTCSFPPSLPLVLNTQCSPNSRSSLTRPFFRKLVGHVSLAMHYTPPFQSLSQAAAEAHTVTLCVQVCLSSREISANKYSAE